MIGILGGTFDPIHYGHLRPAHEVMRAIGLEEVRLVPSARPPHRPEPAVSAERRYEMVRLACSEFPGFVADDRELKRSGPSYTVDTLESLRTELGQLPLCLLMGTDALNGIESWHQWQRLPEFAHIIVMQRPGTTLTAPSAWVRSLLCRDLRELARTPAGRVLFQPVAPQDISSTRVRTALAHGDAVEQWIPKSVVEYIRTHRLYAGS